MSTQELIDNKEILTGKEADQVRAEAPEQFTQFMNHIGNDQWLNINIYCEGEHHAAVQRQERGGY
jgi:hypothetical protein